MAASSPWPDNYGSPIWMNGKKINEILFCEEFLRMVPMRCIGGKFFTVDGQLPNEETLQQAVLEYGRPYFTSGVAKRVRQLIDTMRIVARSEPLPVQTDRIHVANGTVFLDGHFTEEKEFCINRLRYGRAVLQFAAVVFFHHAYGAVQQVAQVVGQIRVDPGQHGFEGELPVDEAYRNLVVGGL